MRKPDPVWRQIAQFLVGGGALAWELLVDRLHHWPPMFVLAAWLMGAPLGEMVKFVTSGRIQINVEREKDDEKEKDDEPPGSKP